MTSKEVSDYLAFWSANKHMTDTQVTLNGIEIFVSKGVFNPSDQLTASTKLILDEIPESLEHKSIWDIGSGSGILTVAAQKKKADFTFATDIDDAALNCTVKNIEYYGLGTKYLVQKTDLLTNEVRANFDFIFANLPILDVSFEDMQGIVLNQYERYLSKDGELWLTYASFGDDDTMKRIADKHPKLIDVVSFEKFSITWYLYKFKK